MPEDRLPPKLLNSWVNHPRKRGRPQITYRNSYACALHSMIPAVDPTKAQNKDWIHVARDPEQWWYLFGQWWEEALPSAPPDENV